MGWAGGEGDEGRELELEGGDFLGEGGVVGAGQGGHFCFQGCGRRRVGVRGWCCFFGVVGLPFCSLGGGLLWCYGIGEECSGGEEQFLDVSRRSSIESKRRKVLVLGLSAAMRRWTKECSVETGDAGEYISSLC